MMFVAVINMLKYVHRQTNRC